MLLPRESLPMDPISLALAPPANETPAQRKLREAEEDEARKVSQRIDDQLKAEKVATKKNKNCVKVLILGQSESGKSTTIKNFQLTYANKAWLEERVAWRSVIYLNLIRSVNQILDILTAEMASQNAFSPPISPISPLSPSWTSARQSHDYVYSPDTLSDEDATTLSDEPRFAFTNKHKMLRMRLAPLRSVQYDLELQIGAGATDFDISPIATYSAPPSPHLHAPPFPHSTPQLLPPPPNPRRPNEFYIRSSSGWKETLSKLRPRLSINTSLDREKPKLTAKGKQKQLEAIEVLAGCGGDIQMLWEDDVVRAVLKKKGVKLDEAPGFFLDDITRVTARDYEPSDKDVLKARLRTVGVQEYKFTIEKGAPDVYGNEIGREWKMFDVGGTRTSRAAWFPYFDDINAIIFLAPISCYDETLAEEPNVNRIDDSIMLWKGICKSKLLTGVQLVVFFNKCDLLQKKLKRGTSPFVKHFPKFGDKHEDVENIGTFFRQEFRHILKKRTPSRLMYPHMTTVVNTKSTAATLTAVREGIVRHILSKAELI